MSSDLQRGGPLIVSTIHADSLSAHETPTDANAVLENMLAVLGGLMEARLARHLRKFAADMKSYAKTCDITNRVHALPQPQSHVPW